MSYWTHERFEDAMFACWAESDLQLGVEHCAAMILPAFAELVPPCTIMDFGCGVGRLLLPFATSNPSGALIGVDSSPQMLDHMAEAASRITVPHGSIEAYLTIPEGRRVDGVYSVVVFQHMKRYELQATFDGLGRVVMDGGVFRFQFVQEGDEGPHNYPITAGDMDALLADAGFGSWRYEADPLFETWTWCTAVRG